MSSTPASTEQPLATDAPAPVTVDLKLEVAVIPVSDVERARHFYEGLGWRLDADFTAGETWVHHALTTQLREQPADLPQPQHGARDGDTT
jgi:catechol 2,3-dioxygenase-like lactoylglutathione lyase family enzyme